MCVTETRVRDFRAFARDTNLVQKDGAYVFKVKENDGKHTTAWELDADASWDRPGFAQTDDHPVTCVNWEEAAAFCRWLSNRETGVTYRLPTDAEWSAAVGTTKYPWGDDFPAPAGAGNYFGEEMDKSLPGSGWPSAFAADHDDGAQRTAPVGSYKPNRYGVLDLGGNVWEWCADWYKDDMNETDVVEAIKKSGFDDGGGQKYRVLRGGSWFYGAEMDHRASARYYVIPVGRYGYYGFRCVVSSAR